VRRVWLAPLLISLCLPGIAQAQRPAGAASAQEKKQAREHYNRGQTHYDLAEYDEAVTQFKTAYELSKAPGLLFNIAQAFRLKGDCRQALLFYRSYLRREPEAFNRVEVEGYALEMEKCAGAPAATVAKPAVPAPTTPPKPAPAKPVAPIVTATAKPTPTPAPVVTPATSASPPPSTASLAADEELDAMDARLELEAAEGEATTNDRPGRIFKLSGMATAGAGVLLLGTGFYFGGKAKSAESDVSDDCADGCVWEDVAALDADGRAWDGRAKVLWGIGGAAAVTGAVLYYLGWRADAKAQEPSVAALPTQGGGILVWTCGY
jgi:tetratricopeptide (TPR) repeat protein